jgi:hypothetical protein
LLALNDGQSQREVFCIVNIHCFDWFCTSKGSRTLGGSSVNDIYCYCPEGCGGNNPYRLAYKHCHILVYECLWSGATDIPDEARAEIVDNPLMLFFKVM